VISKERTMSTTINTDELGGILTIDQAAAYLAIPKATLYTWRTRRPGFGPRAVKFGGCLRYRRADLDAWVAEHVESLDAVVAVPEQRAGGGISLSRTSRPRQAG
jgi:excisionase family DNA binding protein